MNRLLVICCNILWFGSCIPGYFRFRHASCRIKQTQAKRMIRLLQNNKATGYGRKHGFSEVKDWDDFVRLPLSDDKDYSTATEQIKNGENHVLTKDSVEILQPTSGTSSTPKLIPHTKSSAKEFKSALDAWMADLFIQRPRLFWGPQYWSISPATEIKMKQEGEVPVGFLEDAEYFGARRRWVMDRIMAVPAEVRLITDMAANQYVTY